MALKPVRNRDNVPAATEHGGIMMTYPCPFETWDVVSSTNDFLSAGFEFSNGVIDGSERWWRIDSNYISSAELQAGWMNVRFKMIASPTSYYRKLMIELTRGTIPDDVDWILLGRYAQVSMSYDAYYDGPLSTPYVISSDAYEVSSSGSMGTGNTGMTDNLVIDVLEPFLRYRVDLLLYMGGFFSAGFDDFVQVNLSLI